AHAAHAWHAARALRAQGLRAGRGVERQQFRPVRGRAWQGAREKDRRGAGRGRARRPRRLHRGADAARAGYGGVMPEIIFYDTECTTWEGALANNWGEPWQHREIVQVAAARFDTGSLRITE